MKTRELLFYRPDISKYQVSDFQAHESAAIEKISKIKYIKNEEELFSAANLESDIIFCSTSNTNASKFEKIHPRIKLWIHPNSGYDNLGADFVKKATFPIIIGNSIRADAVFLYILNCITTYLGEIPFVSSWDNNRAFKRKNIYNQNFLLIGHGHIGEKVEVFLKSANIKYTIYDPYKNKTTPFELSSFDCVILACSLNESSKYILNHDNLDKLDREICIINAARGELISEAALISYKKKFPEALVFLDVFENEPCDFSKFEDLQNFYKSSHVAGVYDQIDDKIIAFERETISDYQNLSLSDFEVKYYKSNLINRLKDNFLV